MKKFNLSFLFALAAFVPALQATTVIPPSFDQLVDQAQVIFQGSVTGVQSQWVGEGAQRCIVSYVTFAVKDSLKGDSGQTYTIRMLGGTVDGETMGVSDAPKFKVGDEDILFVENNGSQFIPLVGIMHGRFHVRKDGVGRDLVTTNEDEPVKNVARLGQESTESTNSASEPDLTPGDFKAAIKSRIQISERN